MELLWYDIRQLDETAMARTVAMMDEERRRRVSDIAACTSPSATPGLTPSAPPPLCRWVWMWR